MKIKVVDPIGFPSRFQCHGHFLSRWAVRLMGSKGRTSLLTSSGGSATCDMVIYSRENRGVIPDYCIKGPEFQSSDQQCMGVPESAPWGAGIPTGPVAQ